MNDILKLDRQNVALVLGGIANHIPLINKLRSRGFYTVLIDYLENPPAKKVADEHIQISTFDFDAIEKIAREKNAKLIINCTLEHLNKGICSISERLGLPAPYSSSTAEAISDKECMKARMTAAGIPTTKYVCVSKEDNIDISNLKLPVFIKPAQGSGSKGVNIAYTHDDLRCYLNEAYSFYPDSKVIIEEEAKGEEYNVYCFPQNGNPNVLMVARRYSDDISGDHVTKCIGTIGPAAISEVITEKISDTVKKIAKAFNLDNVPMFMQIMIDGDDLNVIEFAGRMAGGFSDIAILETTGFDMYEATINSFLGIRNKVSFNVPQEYITVSSVYAHSCIFNKVIGVDELIKRGVVIDVVIPRLSGTIINEATSNGGKVAFIIAKSDTLSGLIDRIEEAFDVIDVIDDKSRSQIKRNIRIQRRHVGLQ